MASYNEKYSYDAEKRPSQVVNEPVEAGQVSGFRRRLPKFSLEVRQEESSFAATKNASNADFDPIPPSKRTWNWGAYVAYWMADAWAVSNWEVGKYLVAWCGCRARKSSDSDTIVVQLLQSSPSA